MLLLGFIPVSSRSSSDCAPAFAFAFALGLGSCDFALTFVFLPSAFTSDDDEALSVIANA